MVDGGDGIGARLVVGDRDGRGGRRRREEGREGEERDEERGKRSRGWVGMKDK